jgi:hypothetical protein
MSTNRELSETSESLEDPKKGMSYAEFLKRIEGIQVMRESDKMAALDTIIFDYLISWAKTFNWSLLRRLIVLTRQEWGA